ncbi:MAG: hypothetical protein ABSB40_01750 [Nitrososphaeria archaeon]
MNKEIQLRDEAVGVLSKSLSPGKHFQRGWLMGCTSCKVQTIFYLHPEHIQSLFKKGYLTFECVCGKKTNFTLEDLYYDILKYGFYTLKG